MQNHFAVIIVGAGPAGLQCARTLRGSGKSVLVIDRKDVIGPKPCGGGLTHQDEPFGIPGSITRPAETQVIRVGKHEITVHLRHVLRSITRLDLGQFLLKEVQNAPNITVLTGTKVTEIRPDCVVTTKGIFSFTSLVGADGTDSLVRTFLKLPKKITLGFTFDLPVHTEKVLWYFNPRKLKTAYLWSFPKKGNSATSLPFRERPSEGGVRQGTLSKQEDSKFAITNVGGYYDPEEIPFEDVLLEFKAFMAAEGLSFDLSQLKGAPLGILYKGVEFGSIFLAGEAAGMTEALTGEGIAFALTSGQEVARRILDPTYPMPELERILVLKRRREHLLTILRAHARMQPSLMRLGAHLLQLKRFQEFFGA